MRSTRISEQAAAAALAIGLCIALCARSALGSTAPMPPAVRAALAAETGADVLQVGDVASYTFLRPLVNGLGVGSLADLRGKPVLVDFWGRRCPSCIAGSVPTALKLQESFGDDLAVLFVESQGADRAQIEAFALKRRWLGGKALWTDERPFALGSRTLPQYVLLGSDGRVLAKGNPLAAHKEIERRIAEEIRASSAPPQNAYPALRSAWTEQARGRWDRALAGFKAGAAEDPADLELVHAARAALDLLDGRIRRDVRRVDALIDLAAFDVAEARLQELQAALKDDPAWSAELAARRAALDTPALSPEREAARAIGRCLAQVYDSGGAAHLVDELMRLAERHRGTKSAVEAARVVALAQSARD